MFANPPANMPRITPIVRAGLIAGLEPPSPASSPDFTGRIWTVAVRSVGR